MKRTAKKRAALAHLPCGIPEQAEIQPGRYVQYLKDVFYIGKRG
jgi:hypothetical protein